MTEINLIQRLQDVPLWKRHFAKLPNLENIDRLYAKHFKKGDIIRVGTEKDKTTDYEIVKIIRKINGENLYAYVGKYISGIYSEKTADVLKNYELDTFNVSNRYHVMHKVLPMTSTYTLVKRSLDTSENAEKSIMSFIRLHDIDNKLIYVNPLHIQTITTNVSVSDNNYNTTLVLNDGICIYIKEKTMAVAEMCNKCLINRIAKDNEKDNDKGNEKDNEIDNVNCHTLPHNSFDPLLLWDILGQQHEKPKEYIDKSEMKQQRSSYIFK